MGIRLTFLPNRILEIAQDAQHAALYAAGRVVEVVEIEPGAIIQCDGHAALHLAVGNLALVPVESLAQRNDPETELINGPQVRRQRNVVVLRIGIADDIDRVVGEDRDAQDAGSVWFVVDADERQRSVDI